MIPLTLNDIAWISELHHQNFPRGWSSSEFNDLMESGAYGWKIDSDSFILLRSAADEAEILTLATLKAVQRKGYAHQLILRAVEHAKRNEIACILLEVDHTNKAAISLYQKADFEEIALRKNYYKQPDGSFHHALIMQYITTA
jgi:ribosomal-protein-alanine N-acetyltransferase